MAGMFTHRDLQELAALLYGDGRGACAQLADRLDRSKRLMEYYMSGKRAMPARMREKLDEIIDEQIAALLGWHSVHGDVIDSGAHVRLSANNSSDALT